VKARLVVDDAVGETRRLLLDEQGRPFRLHLERWSERGARALLNDVRWGRVRARVPGNRGWFVDLGHGPEGIVEPTQAARMIEGAMLAFRVKAEAWADKGPLLALGDISPKINPPDRPALHEVATLDPFLEGVVVDEAVSGDEARTLVDAAIDEASHGVVQLTGGGDIAIDTTRAAVVIDVDGGARKTVGDAERFAQELNLAAAEAAARQISLRSLGGLVLVDFVGMKQAEGRRALVARFRDALSACLGRSSDVLEMSRLGVVEAAVARRGRPLADALAAGSVERIALETLRAIETAGRQDRGARLAARVSPEVEAWLDHDGIGWHKALADRIGQRWAIESIAGHGGHPDVRSV
jgi:Ribonuclease E/G family